MKSWIDVRPRLDSGTLVGRNPTEIYKSFWEQRCPNCSCGYPAHKLGLGGEGEAFKTYAESRPYLLALVIPFVEAECGSLWVPTWAKDVVNASPGVRRAIVDRFTGQPEALRAELEYQCLVKQLALAGKK